MGRRICTHHCCCISRLRASTAPACARSPRVRSWKGRRRAPRCRESSAATCGRRQASSLTAAQRGTGSGAHQPLRPRTHARNVVDGHLPKHRQDDVRGLRAARAGACLLTTHSARAGHAPARSFPRGCSLPTAARLSCQRGGQPPQLRAPRLQVGRQPAVQERRHHSPEDAKLAQRRAPAHQLLVHEQRVRCALVEPCTRGAAGVAAAAARGAHSARVRRAPLCARTAER